ncbi:MAG: thioredoxin family protein [Chloroflexi bacterium]|nr:thioredoxin family protein [Chloroflexota bacterium]
MTRKSPVLPALLLATLVLAACSSVVPTPTPAATLLKLRPILASTDLAVGVNRLTFALLDARSAPVRASAVEVALAYVQDGTRVPQATVQAVFRPWPAGPGGVFTAEVDFPQAGQWVAELTPKDGEAAGEQARMVIPVQEHSATPSLGSPAPATVNPTARDVASLDEITSDLKPDADLYAMTIAEAERSGKPSIITFATPAFCQSATCGPQVDVVKQLKDAYRGRASFIHVEIYANPKEMQGNPSRGRLAPAVKEWGLPSDPWTFVLDAQGRVAAKYEGFVSYPELEEALRQVL